MPRAKQTAGTEAAAPRARLVDVARQAGVSVSVVGSVLNGGLGNSRVAPATADRIVEIAKQLNYRASPMAQQLRGKRSRVFGLLVASAGDPLTSYLVEHLDEEIVKHGCQTLIGNTAIAPDRFEACVDDFVARGVDGIFCIVHSIFSGDRAKLLARCPNTVFYGDQGVPDAAVVEVDEVAAGRIAAEYLLAAGKTKLGFAILDPAAVYGRARLRGINSTVDAAAAPASAVAVYKGRRGAAGPSRPDERSMVWRTSDEVLDGIIDQLIVSERCDAIIAHNDFLASALLKRLRRRNIAVPDQVAIVGYLNHYLCEYVDPPLTTVDLRHHDAAKAMVQMMEELMEEGASQPQSPRRALVCPSIVVRESA